MSLPAALLCLLLGLRSTEANTSDGMNCPSRAYALLDAVSNSVTNSTVYGKVMFSQANEYASVSVIGFLSGLTPGKHGFHIHQYGEQDDNCTMTGGHFNPLNRMHGGRTSPYRHTGDLGNLVVGASGTVNVQFTDERISLCPGMLSIIGRSLVVHEMEDDLGVPKNISYEEESMVNGNSGLPEACGVIGIGDEDMQHIYDAWKAPSIGG